MTDLRKAAEDALRSLEIISGERLVVHGLPMDDRARAAFAAKDLRAALNRQTLAEAAEELIAATEAKLFHTAPYSKQESEERRDRVCNAIDRLRNALKERQP